MVILSHTIYILLLGQSGLKSVLYTYQTNYAKCWYSCAKHTQHTHLYAGTHLKGVLKEALVATHGARWKMFLLINPVCTCRLSRGIVTYTEDVRNKHGYHTHSSNFSEPIKAFWRHVWILLSFSPRKAKVIIFHNFFRANNLRQFTDASSDSHTTLSSNRFLF